MNRLFSLFLLLCLPFVADAQGMQDLDTVKAPGSYENIHIQTLHHDSLVSSFLIFIKKEVKAHRHDHHAEHVYILEGEGEMILGKEKIKVKKGSLIYIPAGTVHSLKVLSKKPMRVLSLQAPYFDGKDRIPVPVQN